MLSRLNLGLTMNVFTISEGRWNTNYLCVLQAYLSPGTKQPPLETGDQFGHFCFGFFEEALEVRHILDHLNIQ